MDIKMEFILNDIAKEIHEYQTCLWVYKDWHNSCQNEKKKIVLKKMIFTVEDQVEILYKQFTKVFMRV